MLVEAQDLIHEKEKRKMPSLNHSYICAKIISQLDKNSAIICLPELTLKIGKGITPDISVFEADKIKPNFRLDVSKYPEMPILAIEVISSSQNIQDLLIKADILLENGVNAVWTIEPFTNTVFVTTKQGEVKLQNQIVESEGITVDFKKIFG